jgi:hypothetical protein
VNALLPIDLTDSGRIYGVESPFGKLKKQAPQPPQPKTVEKNIKNLCLVILSELEIASS